MSTGNITKRSSAERRRGRTDWAGVDRQTDDDIRAAASGDPDVAPILDDDWFKRAKLEAPQKKERISIKLDSDVLAFFRSQGPRYPTRITAVLRAFMAHRNAR